MQGPSLRYVTTQIQFFMINILLNGVLEKCYILFERPKDLWKIEKNNRQAFYLLQNTCLQNILYVRPFCHFVKSSNPLIISSFPASKLSRKK